MDTKKLRQKILDLAIHGKLVPQDPNDESASVLLERIRAEKERLIKEEKIKRSRKSAKTSDTLHYPQDVPFEVPEGWEWVTIGKLCSFLSRGKSPKYSEERKYPVFAQKCNLYDGDISLEQARFLDPETISKWSDEYKLIDGDILVNSTGTGTVGRTRLFHSDILGDYPFVVPDSHVSVVRTLEEIESKFVLAFLSSDYGQTYIEDNLAGSTNQKELYIGILENMQFPLPPHEEQLRIVTAVDKWFALIDTIDQGKVDLQTAIKQTKSKILDLAIHGKLVPQDPNDEPGSELLKRINPKAEITCDNEHYPHLPKGWSICRLGDVVKYEQPTAYIVQSTAYSDAYPIPVLTAGKSFIIGHTKETEGIYNGLPCIIFDDFTTDSRLVDFPFKVKSSAMKILQVHYGVEVEYVSLFMSITRLVGDTHKRYWISEYSKLEIPIPPQEEQKRIIGKVRLLFEVLDVIEESL
jgi:hypothetical protein